MFSKSRKDANKKKAAVAQTPVKPAPPSIISSDLRIIGNLQSDGEIHVDGTVDGDIRSKVLLIGESANIKGEVVSTTIDVHGTVNGQIKSNSVNLAKTAHVTGDILHENLAIERGAFLEGHCRRMDSKKELGAGNINLVVGESQSADAQAAPGEGARPGLDPKKVATPG